MIESIKGIFFSLMGFILLISPSSCDSSKDYETKAYKEKVIVE